MRRVGVSFMAISSAAAVTMMTACGSDDPVNAELSPAAQAGAAVAEAEGCSACHTATGRRGVGPTWKGSWGSTVTLDDGTSVVFDEDYVVTSVRDPGAQRREGDWVQMPVFTTDSITDDQLASIIDYLKELGAA